MGTYELPKREIKFRVIYKGEKKVSECRGICWDTKKALCFISGCRERREYKKLMQYTGLKDKNGVEIYEGDIIKYDLDGDGTIRQCTFPIMNTQSRHRLGEMQSLVDDGYYIEVIGNIFENPELLEPNNPIT